VHEEAEAQQPELIFFIGANLEFTQRAPSSVADRNRRLTRFQWAEFVECYVV
jgi:hypothetical protein